MALRPKVSIITLNYNGLNWTKKCLKTLRNQTYKNIEIIIADNNSHDGSQIYLKKLKGVTILLNDQNYGFAKGNNLAALKASGEYLFFVNNDTELYKNCVEQLVAHYKEKSILSATQYRPWKEQYPGTSCIGVDIFGYPYGELNPHTNRPFYVDGASLFIKRSDFIKVGMFDEDLFMFNEDIDLSWRAQLYGFKIKPCWEAKLIHFGGGTLFGGVSKNPEYKTNTTRLYFSVRNVIRNIIKNYSLPFAIPILLTLVLIQFVECIVLLLLGNLRAVKSYIQAYVWNIKNISNSLHNRKVIQSNRKIGDSTIIKKMYWSYSKFQALLRYGLPKIT